MKRKAYDELLAWKSGKTRQALLVTGARQVGKTYIVREFGRTEYEQLIEFNLALEDATRESFLSARNPEDLLLRISIAAHGPLIPGKTLIFIDEIQHCPNIITFIKALVDQGTYDYVLSGSLLGVELENIRSYPVGYMTELLMFPMDFEEFCWSMGLTEQAFDVLRDSLQEEHPSPTTCTSACPGYSIDTYSPEACRTRSAPSSATGPSTMYVAYNPTIRRFYNRDITQYAPEDRRLVIQEIYQLIPSELNNSTRRFKIGDISDVKPLQPDRRRIPLVVTGKRCSARIQRRRAAKPAACFQKTQAAQIVLFRRRSTDKYIRQTVNPRYTRRSWRRRTHELWRSL